MWMKQQSQCFHGEGRQWVLTMTARHQLKHCSKRSVLAMNLLSDRDRIVEQKSGHWNMHHS